MASGSRKSSEVLAVELGDRTIKVVQGFSRRKNLTINKVLLVDTPAGSVDQYVITDWEKLATAFKHEIFTRTKSRKIMFVLDHPEVIKMRLTLNLVDDSDLPGLIRYRLSEYLGFDMDNYIIQFSKIEESEDARGMPILDVFVSALPKYIAESYVGLCQELSVEPYLLDTKTNVLQSMIHQGLASSDGVNLEDSQAICFIEMGQGQMEVNIFEDGYFQYNHIVSQGIQSVFQALDKQYYLGVKAIEDLILSRPAEAIDLEKSDEQWYDLGDIPLGVEGENHGDLMRAYKAELVRWIDSLHRVLLLFGGGKEKISQIFIYGDAFDYPEIEALLRQRIRSDIQVIRSVGSLTTPKRLEHPDSEWYRFFNLIGLIAK